jgi:GntR family transcriptional regulator / MocR family aminotransferase
MLSLQIDRQRSHRPYYLQILEQVRAGILSGDIPAGFQLPPSRQLAMELGIARRTVVIAYEELCAQGYCLAQVGKGTVVADVARISVNSSAHLSKTGLPQWLAMGISSSEEANPRIKPTEDKKSQICFAPSLAQTNLLPLKAMQKAFQAVIQTAPVRLQEYDRNNGHPNLLEAICQFILPNRGIDATPDQVLITNGSLHSSFLLAQLFSGYGGSISYGIPGYLPIPLHFIKQGIQGLPCSVDAEGVRLTQEACLARFHYVMPEHHFPQGVTLSPERRTELLQLADRYDALIIEDDYDSEFYFDRHPLPALKAIDRNNRVIYMGTFSKVLFNSLRVGYIVAHSAIIQQLVDLRWRMDGGTSLPIQLWLAELLNSGTINRQLGRMRVHHRKKRNLIANYLQYGFPDWQWHLPSGGLQFWIALPPEQNAIQIVQQWSERGVQIFSGFEYYQHNLEESENHVILGFGAVTENQVHQAFAQLKKHEVLP